MQKYSSIFIVAVTALMLFLGCSREIPTTPDLGIQTPVTGLSSAPYSEDSHNLWGLWTFYIPESRDRVDVEPVRIAQGHMNVLKKLEVDDCSNCVTITKIINNGDSTIDLTVRITHPYIGEPQLTGFDVKGIVMFDGSYEAAGISGVDGLEKLPDPFIVSWRELGDPELLNPDGYTILWSPIYDSGSSLPILNYWPGKYSNGTPTANLNAYLEFYTTEERHMFASGSSVLRTYHIYLPPGPVVVGYAVDACWVPPDVTPVIDPLNDFPISANQPEPYYLRFVINDGEPITHDPCCGWDIDDRCSDQHLVTREWGGEQSVTTGFTYHPPPQEDWHLHSGGVVDDPCEFGESDWYELGMTSYSSYPDGTYRSVGFVFRNISIPGPDIRDRIAFSVFDVTVDLD